MRSEHTRDNVNASVACILVNLPFPPMPMLVLNEDGEDTTASSHDMLASAIGNMVVLQTIPEVANSPLYKNSNHDKLTVLTGLYEANATLLARSDSITAPALQQDIYEMFQHAFRRFMQCYPGSRDLRFAALESVDVGSTVQKQAISHLQAQATLTGEQLRVDHDVGYSTLLETYARRMLADE